MSYVKTAISLDSLLFKDVDGIAREMNLSRSRVISLALEEFVRRYRNKSCWTRSMMPTPGRRHWRKKKPCGKCASTNASWRRMNGHKSGGYLLEAGEANLPRQCVVNISQLYTVDKTVLREIIGALTPGRIRQIIDGLRLSSEPADVD